MCPEIDPGTTTHDQLNDGTEAVLHGGFEPYLSELAELQAGLEGAAATATDSLLPLVDELERAEAVIDSIDKLLDTLES